MGHHPLTTHRFFFFFAFIYIQARKKKKKEESGEHLLDLLKDLRR